MDCEPEATVLVCAGTCVGSLHGSGKGSACQCRFDPWVRKIPGRRKWQPTPVFLPGEIPWTEGPGRLVHGATKESDTA